MLRARECTPKRRDPDTLPVSTTGRKEGLSMAKMKDPEAEYWYARMKGVGIRAGRSKDVAKNYDPRLKVKRPGDRQREYAGTL
jgi:hypothetical protein